ncbi:MAG TPA: ATP-binding protein [Actinomycetota bacterium]|nr:ATP-binding protein [Actinomycetota bacterium]
MPPGPSDGRPVTIGALRRHAAVRTTIFVLLVGLLVTAALGLVTANSVHRNQRTLLVQQADLTAGTLNALVGQLRNALDMVGSVASATAGRPAPIQRASALPSLASFSSLVVLQAPDPAGGEWIPTLTLKPATVTAGTPPEAMMQAINGTSAQGLTVLGVVTSGSARTVALLDRPPGVSQYAVYAEVPFSTAKPFEGLDFALYLADREVPTNLLLASTTHLPLTGKRAVARLDTNTGATPQGRLSTRPDDTTGPPGALLLVIRPTQPLNGRLSADLPWLFVSAGILLSVLASAGFGAIVSSRNAAVGLVKQAQQSEASRDRALEEREEAERHRARLEAQLGQAQRLEAVGHLAGGIAHDFNNLLAVILNFGHFVLQQLEGHPAEDDVKDMCRAAEQAATLTRQLLVFSRKEVVSSQQVDLNSEIEASTRILERVLGEDVAIDLRLAKSLPPVEADVGGVEQVLMNLAVNARDAMPNGGQLTIATSVAHLDESYTAAHLGASTGPNVLLEVTDTGSGMPPEVSLQIFEPFFTTKPAGVGTGMGLATVYGIVSRWGGHISVYSEVGIGTSFKIWLPVQALPSTAPNPGSAEKLERGTASLVLLVEDEPGVRRAAHRILESDGYAVIDAANGTEALEAVAAGPPDVVVTDVIMPGQMSGKALVEELRARFPGLPALFMSGYTADIITSRGSLNPDMILIQKPFTADTLVQGVRRALRAGAAVTTSSSEDPPVAPQNG